MSLIFPGEVLNSGAGESTGDLGIYHWRAIQLHRLTCYEPDENWDRRCGRLCGERLACGPWLVWVSGRKIKGKGNKSHLGRNGSAIVACRLVRVVNSPGLSGPERWLVLCVGRVSVIFYAFGAWYVF